MTTSASTVSRTAPAQDRVRQLQKELSLLQKATAILEAEFGVNPTEPRELGYALTKGVKELRVELAASGYRTEDRYNPFWSDCRRR